MKLKSISFYFALSLFVNFAWGQDSAESESKKLIYSGIINVTPSDFSFPSIGFVNIGLGDFKSTQLGFFNVNRSNFKGLQMSFLNTNGGSFKGGQIGFSNLNNSDFKGVQASFLNVNQSNFKGLQMGFLNINTSNFGGVQMSFLNVNTKNLSGLQLGFANVAKNLSGAQIGLLNIVDTVSSGLPIGFLSIIRKGGYRAVELSFNETYPVNLSFKTGLKKLYSNICLSLTPRDNIGFAYGFGLGGILYEGNKLIFNPEMAYINSFKSGHFCTLSANIGYSVLPKFKLIAGPYLNWHGFNNVSENSQPFFTILEESLDEKNQLLMGVKFGLRYEIRN